MFFLSSIRNATKENSEATGGLLCPGGDESQIGRFLPERYYLPRNIGFYDVVSEDIENLIDVLSHHGTRRAC